MRCSVDGCEGKVFVKERQLCSRHYNRWRQTGTTDDGPKARAPAEERFWRYVVRGPDGECWLWQGVKSRHGYGTIHIGGRGGYRTNAHRLSWEIHNGALPRSDGVTDVILHTCDNRLCVNPAHLRRGTQAENMRDMVLKGRMHKNQPKGERHGNAKFTAKEVKAIRASKLPNFEIARLYGVTRQCIRYIRTIGWKDKS